MAGGHDVDGTQVDVVNVIRAPVAHEEVDLAHCVFDVVAFNPIDRVDVFACTGRRHPDPADIAPATQKTCCLGIGWGGRYCGCCKCTQQGAPRHAQRAVFRHMNSACPVAYLFAAVQADLPSHPQMRELYGTIRITDQEKFS